MVVGHVTSSGMGVPSHAPKSVHFTRAVSPFMAKSWPAFHGSHVHSGWGSDEPPMLMQTWSSPQTALHARML
jgi:hypothetical protein